MTTANRITIARMLLIPVYVVLALAYGGSVARGTPEEGLRWAALGVFVAAAASDGLDGWIARRFDQRSRLGAILDPLADKALVLAAVVTLSLVDWGPDGWRLPAWFAGLVVGRDALILIGIGALKLARRSPEIRPHWSGKACTFLLMFALGWVMLRVVPIPPRYPCLLAALFVLWSAAVYLRQALALAAAPASQSGN